MLFDPEPRFYGLPEEGFELFGIRDRDTRRLRILERIHPALERLGDDLVEVLNRRSGGSYHVHLPRLDWPKGYQPFCTWVAISHRTQGYQSGAQLNVGVHADHVSVRLGWDTSAAAFGRFEFLCRLGGLDRSLRQIAVEHGLHFRVYASEKWPVGSKLVFESQTDVARTFPEVHRRGVWWEIGRRYDLPVCRDIVTTPLLGREAAEVLSAVLPVYERVEAPPAGAA